VAARRARACDQASFTTCSDLCHTYATLDRLRQGHWASSRQLDRSDRRRSEADGPKPQPLARSTREAGRLANDLHGAVTRDSSVSPLRRAHILRSLITYHRHIADTLTVAKLIAEYLQAATEANLIHQRDGLVREVT